MTLMLRTMTVTKPLLAAFVEAHALSAKLLKIQEQHTSTPLGSKQQKLMDSGMWLDDETLHEFDNQVPLHPNCIGFKDQFILDWFTKITRSGQEVEVDHGVPDFGVVH